MNGCHALLSRANHGSRAETLRDFEVHGLIERRDYHTVPPKVDYRLTALGEGLAGALSVIDQWVVDHFFDMAGARDRYLRKKRRTPALEAGA